MKFLAFIMAILVLALSVMPCADTNAMIDNHAKTELTQASPQQHNQSSDVCSPFCHCACCAGFTITHFTSSFTVIPVPVNKQLNSFLPSEVIDITLPVWQPPQLV
jgi:hypothetical protein